MRPAVLLDTGRPVSYLQLLCSGSAGSDGPAMQGIALVRCGIDLLRSTKWRAELVGVPMGRILGGRSGTVTAVAVSQRIHDVAAEPHQARVLPVEIQRDRGYREALYNFRLLLVVRSGPGPSPTKAESTCSQDRRLPGNERRGAKSPHLSGANRRRKLACGTQKTSVKTPGADLRRTSFGLGSVQSRTLPELQPRSRRDISGPSNACREVEPVRATWILPKPSVIRGRSYGGTSRDVRRTTRSREPPSAASSAPNRRRSV